MTRFLTDMNAISVNWLMRLELAELDIRLIRLTSVARPQNDLMTAESMKSTIAYGQKSGYMENMKRWSWKDSLAKIKLFPKKSLTRQSKKLNKAT